MSDLTHVELLWLEKRIENRIRFGHVAEERILDRRRRVLSFAPGSIFAFVRWMSNDFGTVVSRIDILRAVAARPTLLDCPLCQTRRREPLASVRLAKGRARAAVDRCRRGARHRSCRRRARLLASRSQPPVRQRNPARLHKVTPSGMASSTKSRAVTTRNRTLAMTIGAVAILAGTIVAKPSPIYIWNGSESVPLGLYRMRTASTTTSPNSSPFSRPSRWRPTCTEMATCRQEFRC